MQLASMSQEPAPPRPWYQSIKVLLLASILFPPAGLVLLWMRRDTDITKKFFGSVAIAALALAYLFLISGGAILRGLWVHDPEMESHYDELERHRAQQHATAPSEPAAPTASAADSAASPAAGAVAANASTAEAAARAATPAKAARNYWTNFRGPARDGRYDEMPIRTAWSAEGLPLIWKQPIGGGYASFVVAEGVAFTIEQRRRQEVVAAYDLETGRELWTHGWDAEFVESMGGDGPRATPTWDEGRVYALGAQGDLHCVDAKTGKLIWAKNILSDNQATNLQWGMSASPLIVDEKVIVQPGGRSGKSVVAYNKLTGAPIWRALNDTQAYTSPMLVTLAGRKQIITVTASRIVGLAPEDGALLWEYPWDTQMGINISQPIAIDANRFFISAGYGKGAALVKVTKADSRFAAQKVWENSAMKNKFNSSVIQDGYAYGLDEGILTCLDVETGERKWKGGRYGYGQVLLASGHLIVISDQGELALVKATPDKHEEVAKFPAIEGKTWNYPAIANGRLLVRNQTQMACFNLSAQ